ncbi:MAG: metallophosphoesterase [Anaerolineales bacterium]|nr:metallophosphoesterase [Anaerolineales bacterium]
MKIGIISDTHDNLWRLAEAIPHLQTTEAVIHCGDLISPFMIHRLGQGLSGKPVHLVWGNNDGDRRTVSKAAEGYTGFQIHGEYAEIELGNFRIAVNHYPEIGRVLAASDKFDLVCYGHDHTAHDEIIGSTLLLNPGEIMGLNGSSSIVILETETLEFERITIWTE